MPTEIIIALTLWALSNLCMVVMGFMGVSYARILRLGWVTYIALGGWIFFGLFGFVRMALLIQAGLPATYKGIGWVGWTGLVAGFLFTVFLAAAMTLAARNAKQKTIEERDAAAQLHNELFNFRSIRRSNV